MPWTGSNLQMYFLSPGSCRSWGDCVLVLHFTSEIGLKYTRHRLELSVRIIYSRTLLLKRASLEKKSVLIFLFLKSAISVTLTKEKLKSHQTTYFFSSVFLLICTFVRWHTTSAALNSWWQIRALFRANN